MKKPAKKRAKPLLTAAQTIQLQLNQLNEQNRLLREEIASLQDLRTMFDPEKDKNPNAPGSAEFEARNQARLLGQQEGRADAFAEVITDLLKGIFAGSAKQV